MTVLPIDEARRLVAADRGLLAARVEERTDDELTALYKVDGRPLGDSCESLRDLVAHVLMWDEINLAVLTEMARGRRHWSLDAAWDEPEVGRLLNTGGVAAGRTLPVALLLSRFDTIHRSMLDELSRYDEQSWRAGPGAVVQRAMTVPGRQPYRHAAYHLGAALPTP
ncbi:hypothetical protein ACTMTJ_15115 [Phytohabitans sp. LJ34]|uniref:hypothetical protein n=1 Tax=Phytohabitans sp. LJ34 TaxID=3452217 RepID=UPI003F8B85FD